MMLRPTASLQSLERSIPPAGVSMISFLDIFSTRAIGGLEGRLPSGSSAVTGRGG
jgi:hypothetical protein